MIIKSVNNYRNGVKSDFSNLKFSFFFFLMQKFTPNTLLAVNKFSSIIHPQTCQFFSTDMIANNTLFMRLV